MINIHTLPTRTGVRFSIRTRIETHRDGDGETVPDDVVTQRSFYVHLSNEQVELLRHCLDDGGGLDVTGEYWDTLNALEAP